MCADRACMFDAKDTVTGVTCPRDSGDWYVCGITQGWLKRMACIQHLEDFLSYIFIMFLVCVLF